MSGAKELTILQINDSHAYLEPHPEVFWTAAGSEYRMAGGYARLAALVRGIRAETKGACLLADCGDTFHGTYPAVQSQGLALLPVLNAIGPVAMTVHWEFAYTPQGVQKIAAALNYPILAINVYDKKTGNLVFPPYLVKEVGSSRVGLVGIASNIVDKTMPPHFSQGLRFSDGRQELPSYLNLLREKEKVDLVILVSHLGFPQEVELLRQVAGVDVCLSGHTHNRLYQPVVVGQTLVIQSGLHGSFLGRLDLTVEGKRVTSYRHQLIAITPDLHPDDEVEGMISRILEPSREFLGQVVGKTDTPLDRGGMLETTMDNLLLQSIIELTGAEMAFSNGWRYGAPVPSGPVTMNDLYNIIPENPPVSTVNLTGYEIKEMLEENLERTFSRDPFGQMGGYIKRMLGVTVLVKIENPAGQRVQQLFLGEKEINLHRLYRAAFVTEQGVPAKFGQGRQNFPERAVDALKRYLEKHSPVRAELRGTVRVV